VAMRFVEKSGVSSLTTDGAPPTSVTVIVPVRDEEQSLPLLIDRLFATLDVSGHPFEIVAIDDGSSDGSLGVLRAAAMRRQEFRVIVLARNYGKTAALMAGIEHSAGDIIVTIDADLQNDPADIPPMLAKLDEGYDVVSGWRKDRKDPAIRRVLLSRVANRLISGSSGVRLHDYGCGLKAYRREVIEQVRLYGEMHRFVPIYAAWNGARIAEMVVRHYPRQYGVSKYGLERTAKVVLDLMVVRFLDRYLGKPMYLFGGIGLLWIAVSFAAVAVTIYQKLAEGRSMVHTPLLLLAAMFFMMGVTSILIGLVAEIVVRVYYEARSEPIYRAREKLNFEAARRS
jgi:glycosyltransferase involved in cell wall biosynthesis